MIGGWVVFRVQIFDPWGEGENLVEFWRFVYSHKRRVHNIRPGKVFPVQRHCIYLHNTRAYTFLLLHTYACKVYLPLTGCSKRYSRQNDCDLFFCNPYFTYPLLWTWNDLQLLYAHYVIYFFIYFLFINLEIDSYQKNIIFRNITL